MSTSQVNTADPRWDVINKLTTMLANELQSVKKAEERNWLLRHIKKVSDTLYREYPQMFDRAFFYQTIGISQQDIDKAA